MTKILSADQFIDSIIGGGFKRFEILSSEMTYDGRCTEPILFASIFNRVDCVKTPSGTYVRFASENGSYYAVGKKIIRLVKFDSDNGKYFISIRDYVTKEKAGDIVVNVS